MLNVQLFLLLSIVMVSADLSKISLMQVETGEQIFIETSTGRQMLFHGVNAIVKGFPYVPATDQFDADISLTDKDHKALASLGMNVYRLGAMWKGAEPQQGQYNESYFDQLTLITKAAASYGMYTILDMHQDVISEKVCGEGVPDWAVDLSPLSNTSDAFPAPLAEPYTDVSSDGYPTRSDCAKFNWPSYYNTKATGRAFEALYTHPPTTTAWANYWVKVASELGGLPSVLGYELINEPWAGDVMAYPRLLLPGVADRERLQPAYDQIAQAIRQIDTKSFVFFAGVTWDDIVPCGFEHPPNGDGGSVFAFHFYSPPQFKHSSYFHTRRSDAQRLHTGMFLTEFERMEDNSDLSDPFIETADTADRFLVPWTMWEYKTFCKETDETLQGDSQAAAFGSCKTGYGGHELWTAEGELNPVAGAKLARTYAQKVTGIISAMKYETSSGAFALTWAADTSTTGATEIYLHEEFNYPSGFSVQLFPPEKMRWSKLKTNMIEVEFTSLVKNGDRLTVKISRV